MVNKLAIFLFFFAAVSSLPNKYKYQEWKYILPKMDENGTIHITYENMFTGNPESKIVGGQEATPLTWPHQVALFFNHNVFCGGSIISTEFALTTAHCIYGASLVDIVFGAHDISGTVYEASQCTWTSNQLRYHENYNSATASNDIGLIWFPYHINSYSAVAALSTRSPTPGTIVTATGWGKVSDNSQYSSSVLRQVDVSVMSNADCTTYYGSVIKDGMICINSYGGKGMCHGDSGGPLNWNGVITGVASFMSSGGCENGYPHGFTRISYFMDWIQSNTGGVRPPFD